MSEYWKTAPRHYCRYCQTYVRDTKIERAQHDATGRHQGAVQRFLRNLHRDNDRGERDKQRAKDEVARLNGIVSGGESTTLGKTGGPAQERGKQQQRQLAPSDVKSNIAQLASMGVAVPEEYRKDMALAGEWSTVSERPTGFKGVSVKSEVNGEAKPDVDSLSTGVRKKRRLNEDEEDDEHQANGQAMGAASDSAPRGAWGSRFKSYKAVTKDKGESSGGMDIAALMGKGASSNNGGDGSGGTLRDRELTAKAENGDTSDTKKEEGTSEPPDPTAPIKREESSGSPPSTKPEVTPPPEDPPVPKEEDGSEDTPAVFFKKKKKRIKPVE